MTYLDLDEIIAGCEEEFEYTPDSDNESSEEQPSFLENREKFKHIFTPENKDLGNNSSFRCNKGFPTKDLEERTSFISVYCDTEYEDDCGISLQTIYYGRIRGVDVGGSFLVLDNEYAGFITPEIIKIMKEKYDAEIFFDKLNKNLEKPMILEYLICDLEQGNKVVFNHRENNIFKINIKYHFYYSLQDLNISFGRNNMKKFYTRKEGNISQRNNITGTFKLDYAAVKRKYSFNIRLADLYGFETTSLKNVSESCGFSTETKESLDKYKKNMSLALIEEPLLFLEYGLNDCYMLYAILHRKVSIFNSIIKDEFKIDDPGALFSVFTIPLTIGSIVHSLFNKYLRYVLFKNDLCLQTALLKQSILNPMANNFLDNKKIFSELKNFITLKDIEELSEKNPELEKSLKTFLDDKKSLAYDITQYASAKYLVETSSSDKLITSALVSGGRTNNERPHEYSFDYGADIDIAAAYGSILLTLFFPIGRPKVYTTTLAEEKGKTLGDFMKKNEANLTSNLYKLIVSGDLSFDQDLISSRIIPNAVIAKRTKDFDRTGFSDSSTKVPIVILRREIRYGTITAPIWDLLKKVCTNQEFMEIKKLTIDSAVYYLDSDRVDNVEELCKEFLRDKGKHSFNSKSNKTLDTRTYKWYGFAIKDFLGGLAEKRKVLKKMKSDPIAQGMQNHIKLITNTLWGVMSSTFFKINNVVCSELVTSTIKCNIWFLSKALNLGQNITDGGFYSLKNVTFIKPDAKKPGMACLSSYNIYKNHESLLFGSLGGLEYQSLFDNNIPPEEFPNLDILATQHVKNFCEAYKYDFKCSLEHKIERMFLRASFIGKAHYAFLIYNKESKKYDEVFHRIRGFRVDDRIKYCHPIYLLLVHILHNKVTIDDLFYIENASSFQVIKNIKLEGWRIQLKRGVKPLNGFYIKDHNEILPGDTIIFDFQFRLNNTHAFITDLADYKKRNRRSQVNYKHLVDGVEFNERMSLFERYFSTLGIAKTIEMLNKNILQTVESPAKIFARDEKIRLKELKEKQKVRRKRYQSELKKKKNKPLKRKDFFPKDVIDSE